MLSDLPRKSIEPIALAADTAAPTLHEFLVTAHWDQQAARGVLHRRMAEPLAELPSDPLGGIGVSQLTD